MMDRRCWSLWLLLQVLGHIQLVVNQTASSQHNKTIRIGYLASHLQSGGAINVAVDQAQDDGLMPDYNFR